MTSKVFVYPTETSYGIGCDARDVAAVRKIFKIKGRDARKTMTLIVADQKMANKFVVVKEREVKRVMTAYWPGPLTLVLPASAYAKKTLAPGVIAADGTVAIRIPDHVIAREISVSLGGPIVATSANKAGEKPCYSAAAVRRAFKDAPNKPDIIIDEGMLPKRPPSTIARFTNNAWEILRAGTITL